MISSSLISVAMQASLLLDLPIDCDLRGLCAIQQLPDRDVSSERLDFRCRKLAVDGHDGVDFRLRAFAGWRNQPVAVKAAAPGTVLRVRDGMPDRNIREAGAGTMGDRLAGNAVVVDHGDGWETQYSHLREGSVAVRAGDKVVAGDVLGAIGSSGNAEFPHLHFEVRQNGDPIDPFDASPVARAPDCNAVRPGLWRARGAADWVRPNEILALGFASSAEDARSRRTQDEPEPLPPSPSALVVWADVAGLEPGSKQSFSLLDPTGHELLDRSDLLGKGSVSWFAFAGYRRPASGWMPGIYRATYTLEVGGLVQKRTADVTIR